jgi:hypothetical protein
MGCSLLQDAPSIPAGGAAEEGNTHASRASNPLFGRNRFKLGVFSANCDGGLTMSLAPECWRADWE